MVRMVMAAMAGLTALAGAQSVNLKLRPTPGKSYTFRMRVDGTMQGKPRNMLEMTMRMVATAPVKGLTTMETKFISMTSMGKPLPGPAGAQMRAMRVVTTQDARGKIVSSRVIGGPPGMKAPNMGGSVAYPAGPVKVGQSWVGPVSGPTGTGSATYKLIKLAPYKGVPAALVEATSAALPKGTGPVRSWIEVSTGMPLGFDFSLPTPAGLMRTRMERL